MIAFVGKLRATAGAAALIARKAIAWTDAI